MSIDIDAKVEEMKSPATFDVRAALNNQTYATDKVRVYVNAAVMHTANIKADEVAKLRREAEFLEASHGGITTPEEATAKEEEADALEAEVADLIKSVQDSALDFHLRGLPPKQIQLIDKKWRKEIKFPVRSNYENTPEGQEEFEMETWERNKDRNEMINHDAIANCIFKVVRASDGAESTSVWKAEDVKNLFETVLETEYEKLRLLYQDLTFAHTIFDRAIVEDADFLSKP
jgi:hypothetical protein